MGGQGHFKTPEPGLRGLTDINKWAKYPKTEIWELVHIISRLPGSTISSIRRNNTIPRVPAT